MDDDISSASKIELVHKIGCNVPNQGLPPQFA